MTQQGISGFRVLVVEDEMLIALDIEATLHALGCVVIGPMASLKDALRAATFELFDAAILDVTIRNEFVYPVAEKLLQRDIPFALASGYGQWALPESMRAHPRLTKPFTTEQLEAQILALLKMSADRKSHIE